MQQMSLPPAAAAFDAVADDFDERFGGWQSVAAQRRAVRAELARVFPVGSRLVELGGGTGEDAAWLGQRGRVVHLTDPSPAMVRIAAAKLAPVGLPAPLVASAEALHAVAHALKVPLDGAFSNFAALNCVRDLRDVARGLASIVRPGGGVVIVLFGAACPGEWITQLVRGRPRAMFRRGSRTEVEARLGGREFMVKYHRAADIRRAFAPEFEFVGRRGIGVFVPPSDAEPWISAHPRLLTALEKTDVVTSRRLAAMGDHVLYHFRRAS